MLEVTGKSTNATIFAEGFDPEVISQVIAICNQPYAENEKVRIMPDCHPGAGCVIGTTMTTHDKICPNIVGVDIGCGMAFVKIDKDRLRDGAIDWPALDNFIRVHIPSGMHTHAEEQKNPVVADALANLKCKNSINISHAMCSLGTLGGGNHFIEVGVAEETDGFYLVIHSGSRNLGVKVASHYQMRAKQQCAKLSDEKQVEMKARIEELKSAGRQREIEGFIREFRATHLLRLPVGMEFVSGALAEDYIHDAHIATLYAQASRNMMAKSILGFLYGCPAEKINERDIQHTIHNYVEPAHDGLPAMIRKGAIRALKGETVLIPLNMRDGSIIATGKGNPDWNYSAPHGAGRMFSRREAKELFDLEEFKHEMRDVQTWSVGYDTLDESPMAYKDAASIIDQIQDTVDIQYIMRPVYNFKAP